MARFRDIACVTTGVLVLVLAASTTQAQTNATQQWLSHDPVASSAVSSNTTPAEEPNGDAEHFFQAYRQALDQYDAKKFQDAGITMDLASRNLTTSPWLELSILKHAQIVEASNDRVSEQDYQLVRQRIENAPYYQGNIERAKSFGAALQAAVDNGVDRIRLRRVKDALEHYHARYAEYPESLAKLAILNYTDMENIHTVNNQLFSYIPQSPRLKPFISYQRYDLERIEPEPFSVDKPILEATSQVSEKPLKYSAVVDLRGLHVSRAGQDAVEINEPARVLENQTVGGFFIIAVTHDGVILSTPTRIIILIPRHNR